MSMTNCPECKGSISSVAKACPHCGYPLQNTVERKKSHLIKKAIAIIVSVVIVAAAALIITNTFQDNPSQQVINSDLGHVVSIGMSKSDVDKLLGDSSKFGSYYEYSGGLTITYENGKVQNMSLSGPLCEWETGLGVEVGDTVDVLFEAYGEQELTDISTLGDGNLGAGYIAQYYFDSTGHQSGDVTDPIVHSFHIDDSGSRVETISVGSH